jgi:hypothetical protein
VLHLSIPLHKDFLTSMSLVWPQCFVSSSLPLLKKTNFFSQVLALESLTSSFHPQENLTLVIYNRFLLVGHIKNMMQCPQHKIFILFLQLLYLFLYSLLMHHYDIPMLLEFHAYTMTFQP